MNWVAVLASAWPATLSLALLVVAALDGSLRRRPRARLYLLVGLAVSVAVTLVGAVNSASMRESLSDPERLRQVMATMVLIQMIGVVTLALQVFAVLLAAREPGTAADGSSLAPEDDRWNWVAFLFTPIWALVKGVYWGLLAMVPGLGLIASVYMGIFGRELAAKRARPHDAPPPITGMP